MFDRNGRASIKIGDKPIVTVFESGFLEYDKDIIEDPNGRVFWDMISLLFDKIKDLEIEVHRLRARSERIG